MSTDTTPVIASYLTVGGATVDITHESGYTDRDRPTHTKATCSGCTTAKWVDWWTGSGWGRPGNAYDLVTATDRDDATTEARNWAQSHAETCRAMPLT